MGQHSCAIHICMVLGNKLRNITVNRWIYVPECFLRSLVGMNTSSNVFGEEPKGNIYHLECISVSNANMVYQMHTYDRVRI